MSRKLEGIYISNASFWTLKFKFIKINKKKGEIIMNEEKYSEIKEDLKNIIHSLVGLCPAYNSIVRILRDGNEKFIGYVKAAYPEILDRDILSVLLGLFDVETGETLLVKRNGIGDNLVDLINKIEEKLDKKEIRDLVSESMGEGVPNPVKDYIEGCIDVLKKNDEIALKLIKLIAADGWYNLNNLIEKVNETYKLNFNNEEIFKHLKNLEDLGLLESLNENRIEIIKKYCEHILNLTK